MMKVKNIHWILLEDEHHTANELQRLVASAGPHYCNIATIETCGRFREFWRSTPDADLIITDESLADGPVATVFHDMDVSAPVIVVTSNETCTPLDFRATIVRILLHPVGMRDMDEALREYEDRHSRFVSLPADSDISSTVISRN